MEKSAQGSAKKAWDESEKHDVSKPSTPEAWFKQQAHKMGHVLVQTLDSMRCSACSRRWTAIEIARGQAIVTPFCVPAKKESKPYATRALNRAQLVVKAAQAIVDKLEAYRKEDVKRDLNDTVEITLRMTLETIEKQLLLVNCPPPPSKR